MAATTVKGVKELAFNISGVAYDYGFPKPESSAALQVLLSADLPARFRITKSSWSVDPS